MARGRIVLVGGLLVLAVGLAVTVIYRGSPTEQGITNRSEGDGQNAPKVIAQDLTVPWGIAVLPDGDLLVSERSGTLKRIGDNRQMYQVEGVQHIGEGGLLGVALHHNFEDTPFIYLYMTTRQGEGLMNRVDRYRYQKDKLTNRETILPDIPGAAIHDGGRLAFGPDRNLYITTGDAGNEQSAQDTDSLAGKILRIKPDGDIPADNPFDNAVYSYGHRNPQGLAWDDQGRLWSTEHGSSRLDELNLIKKGANYGWPIIEGDESRDGMERPVLQSGSRETWAPAGLTYWNGSLFFAGLRGESLYEAKLKDDDTVTLTAHFSGEFGRLRASTLGTDDTLYISTSNTDGRGNARANDDKIIRLNTSIFRR